MRKRQERVGQWQAWNVWTRLKTVSSSMEMPEKQVVNNVTVRESHLRQASSQTGREDESGLSCSVVARSPKDPSDRFVGHTVISGHLAQGFVVFTDTAHHVGPFFRWDTVLRLAWTHILL